MEVPRAGSICPFPRGMVFPAAANDDATQPSQSDSSCVGLKRLK